MLMERAMSVRDLLPSTRNAGAAGPGTMRTEPLSPVLTLHREMNRLFDDVFSGLNGASTLGRGGVGWPSVDYVETDEGLRVSAELPGLDATDVEVLIEDGVLTLRGEKRSETSDAARGYTERTDGRFERTIALPFAVAADKAEATFRHGVLSVTLPRSAQVPASARRIAITGGAQTETAPLSGARARGA
jgi:HSP20 family protein